MATPKNILVMHGPNLNLLGTREPAHYGSATLATINQKLTDRARTAGVTLETYQSNIEGELVSWIQEARTKADAVILNLDFGHPFGFIERQPHFNGFSGPVLDGV